MTQDLPLRTDKALRAACQAIEAAEQLRILRNERVVDAAAWYVEEKTPLVRFVAEKPR